MRHHQREQIPNRKHGHASAGLLTQHPPLPPAHQGQAGREIRYQASDALVAEPSAGKVGFGADPMQPTILNRLIKGAASAHQGQHSELEGRALLVDGLQDAACNRVFAMAIAENKQARMAAADTILAKGFGSLSGGMAKW